MSRTPFAIMAVLAVVLLGLSALGGGEESGSAPAGEPATASIPVIAKRVADIRGFGFKTVPEPLAVTPEQAKREGLEDLDRNYPPDEQRADEEILKLLGLIEPSVRLRDISAATFSQGVAGYYDPRTKRLRIVKGTATGSRVVAEMVLAHELTHALEDQKFGLGLADTSGSDDRALARLAMVEGTASWLMARYTDEHFTEEESLGGALAAAFGETASLPAFLQAQLIFPYVGGQAFIEALRSRAGGRWDLVDLAERSRPPLSTEQVIHPAKYLRSEPPDKVRLRLRDPVGAGFSRTRTGTLGELQTREMLLEAGGGGSGEAAEGWGGDRYELWQRDGAKDCEAPCRQDSVLALRWTWDTARDEAEFADKLRQWVPDALGADPAGEGAWTLDGGAIALARGGGAVTLVLAPSAEQAARVASAR